MKTLKNILFSSILFGLSFAAIPAKGMESSLDIVGNSLGLASNLYQLGTSGASAALALNMMTQPDSAFGLVPVAKKLKYNKHLVNGAITGIAGIGYAWDALGLDWLTSCITYPVWDYALIPAGQLCGLGSFCYTVLKYPEPTNHFFWKFLPSIAPYLRKGLLTINNKYLDNVISKKFKAATGTTIDKKRADLLQAIDHVIMLKRENLEKEKLFYPMWKSEIDSILKDGRLTISNKDLDKLILKSCPKLKADTPQFYKQRSNFLHAFEHGKKLKCANCYPMWKSEIDSILKNGRLTISNKDLDKLILESCPKLKANTPQFYKQRSNFLYAFEHGKMLKRKTLYSIWKKEVDDIFKREESNLKRLESVGDSLWSSLWNSLPKKDMKLCFGTLFPTKNNLEFQNKLSKIEMPVSIGDDVRHALYLERMDSAMKVVDSKLANSPVKNKSVLDNMRNSFQKDESKKIEAGIFIEKKNIDLAIEHLQNDAALKKGSPEETYYSKHKTVIEKAVKNSVKFNNDRSKQVQEVLSKHDSTLVQIKNASNEMQKEIVGRNPNHPVVKTVKETVENGVPSGLKKAVEEIKKHIKNAPNPIDAAFNPFKRNIYQMARYLGAVTVATAGSVFVAKKVIDKTFKPSLVTESSSDISLKKILAYTGFSKESNLEKPMIFNTKLDQRIENVMQVTKSIHEHIIDGSENIKFRNLLLYGAPGTGKTTIAKKIAKDAGMSWVRLNAASFDKFSTEEALQEMDKLFAWANRYSLSKKRVMIFIDECEKLVRSRASMQQDSKEYKLLTYLLDCAGKRSAKYMLVFATNKKENMDSAMQRRIDDAIEFELPDQTTRETCLNAYIDLILKDEARNSEDFVASAEEVLTTAKVKDLAQKTNGFSQSDIQGLVNVIKTDASLEDDTVSDKLVTEAVANYLQKKKALAS